MLLCTCGVVYKSRFNCRQLYVAVCINIQTYAILAVAQLPSRGILILKFSYQRDEQQQTPSFRFLYNTVALKCCVLIQLVNR